jgi:hypothetical protein
MQVAALLGVDTGRLTGRRARGDVGSQTPWRQHTQRTTSLVLWLSLRPPHIGSTNADDTITSAPRWKTGLELPQSGVKSTRDKEKVQMGDKGKKDKDKREQQQKARQSPKEKRKQKKEKQQGDSEIAKLG